MLKCFGNYLLVGISVCCLSAYTINDNSAENYAYYSDYFVFIADDATTPLVIPLDINWSVSDTGYSSEFKAWYGTPKNWPISYHTENTAASPAKTPNESWEHKNGPSFQFDSVQRNITVKIKGAPRLEVTVPEKSTWVQMPAKNTPKEIYGCRTTVTIKTKKRTGWMIYERIRWTKETVREFGDFAAFFWLPLIVDGDFYHFEQHRGEQTATKWSLQKEKIVVETLPSFTLNIVRTVKDSQSGRKNIPKEVQLLAKPWDLDLMMRSKGEQVGYGAKFPNGLAYYRQSLLTSTKSSSQKGYGMLELILEDD
ncbi:hypothetical protein [Spongiimicrobium salis]|uniref:hypothetical protein n=1 Tax=Spongiimicrobium salis TaxID=1667022 RepID=UPI00374CA1EA